MNAQKPKTILRLALLALVAITASAVLQACGSDGDGKSGNVTFKGAGE